MFIAIGWIPFAAYGQVAVPTKSKGTDPVIDQLDQDLPRLTSVFSYSLQKDGLSDKRLKITPLADRMKVAATTDGVRLVQRRSTWKSFHDVRWMEISISKWPSVSW